MFSSKYFSSEVWRKQPVVVSGEPVLNLLFVADNAEFALFTANNETLF
jgi:hypothetical protein